MAKKSLLQESVIDSFTISFGCLVLENIALYLANISCFSLITIISNVGVYNALFLVIF